jgi:hypothetical protein
MHIEVTLTWDDGYQRRLVRDLLRRRVWGAALAAVGSLLIAVLCFLTGDGRAVAAGLLELILFGTVYSSGLTLARRALTRFPPYAREPTTLTLTDEGVSRDSASVSTRVAWPALARAVERPYAYLLFTVPGQRYVDVPRTALSPADEAQLRKLLVMRRLLPAPADPIERGPVDERR